VRAGAREAAPGTRETTRVTPGARSRAGDRTGASGEGPSGGAREGAPRGPRGERAGGRRGAPPRCTTERAWGPQGRKKKGRGRRRERGRERERGGELTSATKSGDLHLQNLGHHGGEREVGEREGVAVREN
jgi:hypothetical protein